MAEAASELQLVEQLWLFKESREYSIWGHSRHVSELELKTNYHTDYISERRPTRWEKHMVLFSNSPIARGSFQK
jgi:hypothetical protein